MSDIDEPEPLKAFRDRRGYCPACCGRVNLRRTVCCCVVIVAALVTLLDCVLR